MIYKGKLEARAEPPTCCLLYLQSVVVISVISVVVVSDDDGDDVNQADETSARPPTASTFDAGLVKKSRPALFSSEVSLFWHRSKNWAKKKLPKKLKCPLGLFSDFYFAKNLKFMSDEFYAPSSVRERAADSGMGF